MKPAEHPALKVSYRKALAVFIVFPPAVVLLNAVAYLLVEADAVPDPTLSVVLFGVGVFAAASSFIVPRLLAHQRRSVLSAPEATFEAIDQIVMWELFIRLALAEVPGILAFVITTMTGARPESTVLEVVSLAAIAAAYPRWSSWQSAFASAQDSDAGQTDPGA